MTRLLLGLCTPLYLQRSGSADGQSLGCLQGVELYNHSLAPVPNSFDMEHANIAEAPAAASLVLELHDMLHRQFTKPWSSAMKSDDGGSAAAPLRPKPPYRGWAFGSNLTNQELYPPGAALSHSRIVCVCGLTERVSAWIRHDQLRAGEHHRLLPTRLGGLRCSHRAVLQTGPPVASHNTPCDAACFAKQGVALLCVPSGSRSPPSSG